jgi:PTS system cellobiose-specific IIA component
MEFNLDQIALDLITKAGDAKNLVFEAFDSLIEGNFAKAEQLLEQADSALTEAQSVHEDFLQHAARGETEPPNYLLVHALDILMSAMSERDITRRLVALETRHQKY